METPRNSGARTKGPRPASLIGSHFLQRATSDIGGLNLRPLSRAVPPVGPRINPLLSDEYA